MAPNKPFKSKHASKHELKRKHKGRVPSVKAASQTKIEETKDVRRNRSLQLRRQAKAERLSIVRRGLIPPRVVVVISLSTDLDVVTFTDALSNCSSHTVFPGFGHKTSILSDRKQRLTFLPVQSNSIESVLHACLAADLILVAVSATAGISQFASSISDCIKQQGLPPILCSLHNLNEIHQSKRGQHRKFITSQLEELFTTSVRTVVCEEDYSNLIRFIKEIHIDQISWRQYRPYLLAHSLSRSASGNLLISGYVRGAPMSVNRLAHLVGFGDFMVKFYSNSLRSNYSQS
ncbi:hypothetical protein RCL1_004093 [Eukaryota sp. TZLM3-RCL]